MTPTVLTNTWWHWTFSWTLLNTLFADTCKLASKQESFDEVKEAEVQQFREQLDGVIAEVTRTLENQSPAGIPQGDATAQQQCKYSSL